MTCCSLKTGLAAVLIAALASTAFAGSIKIESWRNDDADIWKDKIIPAFNAEHDDIQVEFAPSSPSEYDASLNARLESGTAGDLITCRPFDASLELFKQGHLAPLNELGGMANFSAFARSAWTTDDGATTFCLPMGAVIHGFMYNKDAFAKVGASVPKTEDEFFAVLEKFKQDGTYVPLAMGTYDQWEAATVGFQNIGPNHWLGETGRAKLINGQAKFTDTEYVKVWTTLAKWGRYLGDGYKAQKYLDSQNLFSLGKAAIYPAGSWDISTFRKDGAFKLGAFAPPVPAGAKDCYISPNFSL